MMERLCGYLIAAGFAAVCFAGYRWWTGQGDAAIIVGGGVVMIVAGFWLSGRVGEEDE